MTWVALGLIAAGIALLILTAWAIHIASGPMTIPATIAEKSYTNSKKGDISFMMPKDLLEHLEKGAPGDELEFLRPKPESKPGPDLHDEISAFAQLGSALALASAADAGVMQIMERDDGFRSHVAESFWRSQTMGLRPFQTFQNEKEK